MRKVLFNLLLSLAIIYPAIASDEQREDYQRVVKLADGVKYNHEGLIQHAYLHNKECLRLQGLRLTGFLSVFAQLHPNVRMLHIDNCGALDAQDVAEIKRFRRLQYVKLCDIGLCDEMLHTLLDALPDDLVCLDLGELELSAIGLITLLNSDRMQSIRKLALWTDRIETPFSNQSIALIYMSNVGKALKQLAISLPDDDSYPLSSLADKFADRVWCPYDEFYEEGRELYLMDNPLDKGFVWQLSDGEWDLIHIADQLEKQSAKEEKHETEILSTKDLITAAAMKLRQAIKSGEIPPERVDIEDDQVDDSDNEDIE